MKEGSGNLDFSQTSDDAETESESKSQANGESSAEQVTPQSQQVQSTSETTSSQSTSVTDSQQDPQGYPYFVRRSNVGDERDNRLEVHLRSEVSNQESEFRSALASALETDEVPKTDAREFALKYAFENPEDVAELMRDEGFGLLD